MLIYVNQFKLVGEHISDIAFQSIAGWLKHVTKRHFTIDELKSGEEFTIERAKVRTYIAVDREPKLYAILFSHPDKTVKGRQWITEIGIKQEKDATTVSILLETSDISTLVKEIPSTTRPRLVNFLQQNAQLHDETIGLRVFNYTNTIESFKALSYEIERESRKHPLVIVSNLKKTNKPLINPIKLQEQLLGLAQVIHSHDDINTWDFENILTRRYSAWDGAVNIIYPSYGRGFCHTKLLSQTTIIELIDSGFHVLQSILSFITHTTNGFNKKRHFSPSDVRAKRQRDQRSILKDKLHLQLENNEFQQLAEEAFIQLEEQEALFEQLKEQHQKEIESQILEQIENQTELEKTIMELQVLKIRFDEIQKLTSKKGTPLLVCGEEKEFYSGEFSDLSIEIFKTFLDNETKNTRKKHIIQDILKHNEVDGTKASYINICKQIFNNYNGVTPKIRSELNKMNLEIIEDGNHNQIKFINDARYQVTCAKTPSDKRTGDNIVRDIKAALF
ncbi:hypothetical protein [Aeromonas sp. FDAARGOS 1417]|nr:hypothetical protein [Aeromonas sp. FDAARGOS 1417]QWZ63943.1 hypothetical protein I6L47_20140 [Aeromonas sp. FDAARGOS 1417]